MPIVKMFKQDAIIPIDIGPNFVRRIQQLLIFITADLPQEELDNFYELVKKGEQKFSEDWMEHVFTLTVLLGNIETVAEKNGMTYDQVVPDKDTDDEVTPGGN
jgi:hypothetical protein